MAWLAGLPSLGFGSALLSPGACLLVEPRLQEKKKVLDKHTNLATSLLGAIKARGLDGFYNTEEDLLVGKADAAGLAKLLQVRAGVTAAWLHSCAWSWV